MFETISENSRKVYVADLANDIHCNIPPEALIQFPVMRPPIGWNEFPTIFWSDFIDPQNIALCLQREHHPTSWVFPDNTAHGTSKMLLIYHNASECKTTCHVYSSVETIYSFCGCSFLLWILICICDITVCLLEGKLHFLPVWIVHLYP